MPMDVLLATETARAISGARPAGPCAMVVFGAGGDLTRRLVVRALHNLMAGRLLPKDFVLIGVGIAALSAEQWRERLAERADMVEEGGRIMQSVLDARGTESPSDYPNYPAGSVGPQAAAGLLAQAGGRAWPAIGHHV
jgi:glucose-6-phosphate 1-dehydrogenase